MKLFRKDIRQLGERPDTTAWILISLVKIENGAMQSKNKHTRR